MIYLKYLWSLLQHKYYVFVAGVKIGGIPLWRLIIHDWQKFLPVEFIPYARYFQGGKQEKDKESFMYAWLHHVKFGEHHWNHWILESGYNFATAADGVLPMPKVYIREMVADWLGASMAYTGSWDMTDFLKNNLLNDNPKIKLHQLSKIYLMVVLSIDLGYDIRENRIIDN